MKEWGIRFIKRKKKWNKKDVIIIILFKIYKIKENVYGCY